MHMHACIMVQAFCYITKYSSTLYIGMTIQIWDCMRGGCKQVGGEVVYNIKLGTFFAL